MLAGHSCQLGVCLEELLYIQRAKLLYQGLRSFSWVLADHCHDKRNSLVGPHVGHLEIWKFGGTSSQ